MLEHQPRSRAFILGSGGIYWIRLATHLAFNPASASTDKIFTFLQYAYIML